MTGGDLTRIDGMQAMTVQTVITEAGLDMSAWPTEHHFIILDRTRAPHAAITATAAKLARLIYRMLLHGEQ